MTARWPLLLTVLAAACTGVSDPDASTEGSTAFATVVDSETPVPAFAIYTPELWCLGKGTVFASAEDCGPDSDLFSWDESGSIRNADGECLEASFALAIGTPDGPPPDMPLVDVAVNFDECGGSQWAYSEARIYMPDPMGYPVFVCLEGTQTGPLGTAVYTDIVESLDDCPTDRWFLADNPQFGGPGGNTCDVDLTIQSSWNTGFVGEVTVDLYGAEGVSDWTMDWSFGASNAQITSLWNAGGWTQTGHDVLVEDAGWNALVGPNESVSIGFVANGAPPAAGFEDFFFNGIDCVRDQVVDDVDGYPIFPIWTLGSEPECLQLDVGQNVGYSSACNDPILFRWLGSTLETFGDLCLTNSISDAQLLPCDGSDSQNWSRSIDGALYMDAATGGISCLAQGDEGLYVQQAPDLDFCAPWSQGELPAVGGGSCQAEVVAINSWPGGFVGNANVTWTGAPISAWQMEWMFHGGEAGVHFWNGVGFQVGTDVQVFNESWNGVLNTGDTVSVGFVATGALDDVSSFLFNGEACSVP